MTKVIAVLALASIAVLGSAAMSASADPATDPGTGTGTCHYENR